jgi:hypothetical protein
MVYVVSYMLTYLDCLQVGLQQWKSVMKLLISFRAGFSLLEFPITLQLSVTALELSPAKFETVSLYGFINWVYIKGGEYMD